jgi:hypothetical protein
LKHGVWMKQQLGMAICLDGQEYMLYMGRQKVQEELQLQIG